MAPKQLQDLELIFLIVVGNSIEEGSIDGWGLNFETGSWLGQISLGVGRRGLSWGPGVTLENFLSRILGQRMSNYILYLSFSSSLRLGRHTHMLKGS